PFLVEEQAGPRVIMRIKADQDCASVAAASVIAKVERDALMTRLHAEHPQYGWEGNKGYGAAVHTEAIRTHGVTRYHRTSWNLGV
ncbi:MAG: Ribonuclease, partial [Actinomycetota bacterium]